MDEDKLDSIKRAMEDEETDMEKNSFTKRFGWFVILNRVCSDDITRHSEIINKTILEVLNQLSYMIEKQNEIDKMERMARGHVS